MKFTLHTDIQEFLAVAGPMLEAHEVENGLMLGLTLRAQKRMQTGVVAPIKLLSVSEGNRVLAAAVQTPPHNLILSQMAAEVVEPLADFLLKNDWNIPGVLGPDPIPQLFAEIWSRKTGLAHRIGVEQMIYQLQAVQPTPTSSGTFAQATLADLDTIVQFFIAFEAEALYAAEPSSQEEHRRKAKLRIMNGHLFVWKDQGEIVSMAGVSAPTPHGIRVNAVYTPPEYRGNGYASSNVAAVSQHQLDQGNSFCFLYTDASNPTSNKIYQRIGYEFICNSALYRFT